ncbi:MAG: CopM family metallochaperone [Notoacmeibacter sp.]
MATNPAKVDGMVDHAAMGHGTPDSESTAAYRIAMDQMMKGMMVPYTGNADLDFAAGMIPHHQGAIDMAKVVLKFGTDPELRKLAEEIVGAQETEIAFMQNWLKANAK